MNKYKKGFTLFELLIVIVIIVLLYAALLPAYLNYKKRMVVFNATVKIYGDINEAIAEVDSKKLIASFAFYPNGTYSITYSSTANLEQKNTKKTAVNKKENAIYNKGIIGTAYAGGVWWWRPQKPPETFKPTPTPTFHPAVPVPPPPPAAPVLPSLSQKTQYINPVSGTSAVGNISIQLPGNANKLEIQPYSKNISGQWVRNVMIFKNGSSEVTRTGDIVITDGKNQGIIRVTESGRIELVK